MIIKDNKGPSMNTQLQDSKTPERSESLEEQLSFKSRTVLLFGEINDKSALQISRRLLALAQESDAPITMMISSPGGHVESGDAIHDMINFIPAPVTVVGSGWVGSAAAHIFLAPPKERRVCLPNTRFLIHQPAGGAGGQASDIAIQAEQILLVRDRIANVIARQTGQPLERVKKDIERDYWMPADKALEYGIISRIINKQTEVFA